MKLTERKIVYAVESQSCQHCGHVFKGKVCNLCGEKVFNEKHLSTGHFFHQVIDFFYHFENKVIKTIWLNFIKPGFITAQNLKGIRVPYANPVQLYLVVSLIFYLVVSKVGLRDYIPSAADHHYFYLSGYPAFQWAKPLDEKVVTGIDSLWVKKGRDLEAGIRREMNNNLGADGSYTMIARGRKDSFLIPPDKLPVLSFEKMREARESMFNAKVGSFGKILPFLLLPLIAGFFYLLFFRKLKYYGAGLVLATHFMVYNLCFYTLYALVIYAPIYIYKPLSGWALRPFFYAFYNDSIRQTSEFVFGQPFEFMHLLFWMPWLFMAFKRLFQTNWWQSLLAGYLLSKVFYFLVFGVLKKIVIAVTIWSMH